MLILQQDRVGRETTVRVRRHPGADLMTDRRLAERALRYASKNRKTPMPFTVGYLQRVCGVMGYRVGEHRAAKMINGLKRRGRLVSRGDYRSRKHGFRVTLYCVPQISLSVRRKASVKPISKRNWWKHGLFGTPDGLPPPS